MIMFILKEKIPIFAIFILIVIEVYVLSQKALYVVETVIHGAFKLLYS